MPQFLDGSIFLAKKTGDPPTVSCSRSGPHLEFSLRIFSQSFTKPCWSRMIAVAVSFKAFCTAPLLPLFALSEDRSPYFPIDYVTTVSMRTFLSQFHLRQAIVSKGAHIHQMDACHANSAIPCAVLELPTVSGGGYLLHFPWIGSSGLAMCNHRCSCFAVVALPARFSSFFLSRCRC